MSYNRVKEPHVYASKNYKKKLLKYRQLSLYSPRSVHLEPKKSTPCLWFVIICFGTCVWRGTFYCKMLTDDHPNRPSEDCSSPSVSAGRPQDWPLLRVWSCRAPAAHGNVCPHRSLVGLHLVSLRLYIISWYSCLCLCVNDCPLLSSYTVTETKSYWSFDFILSGPQNAALCDKVRAH
jgi:hypothetical protein